MTKKQIYKRFHDREEIEKVSKKEALRALRAMYPTCSNLFILNTLEISSLYTYVATYSMNKEYAKH